MELIIIIVLGILVKMFFSSNKSHSNDAVTRKNIEVQTEMFKQMLQAQGYDTSAFDKKFVNTAAATAASNSATKKTSAVNWQLVGKAILVTIIAISTFISVSFLLYTIELMF